MERSDSPLTLGYISYLNCVPFFGRLKEQGFNGNLVPGVPSALNRMLQQGEIDASPSSSFEYARNWRDYLLLPGHSISSVGSIASVLLFSPVSPDRLGGVEIALTGESATSINLLEILLRDYYGLNDVVTRVPSGSVEDLVSKGIPALLIGDRALKLSTVVPLGIGVYDLGKLWHQHTGLPFVFALWMIRKGVVQRHAEALGQLGEQLLKSREAVMQQPLVFAEAAALHLGFSPEQIISYWQTIDYRLDQQHLEGLNRFFDLCVDYGLLGEMPELRFL
ncbi:menaquinone biosynthetic enzyme MqnA/MqnD family protein [Pelovirga terrestris]|uniref:Chorismate dehydratase n=1 Tax=Pelovirga terrestris TaxID=2771352 RepID=A0A8J6QPG7_9BACT|nr:menaquinone biosynthesis protein [Pelovirga terrestris]MBD1399430.1 menaquinone biosynthesis protein [Pelovirga terrestris]